MCEYFLFRMTWDFGRHFFKSKNIGRHFCQIKASWAPFLMVFSESLPRFLRILRKFSQILARFSWDLLGFCPDFHQIKTFGVVFALPVASPPSPLLCVMRCGKTHFSSEIPSYTFSITVDFCFIWTSADSKDDRCWRERPTQWNRCFIKKNKIKCLSNDSTSEFQNSCYYLLIIFRNFQPAQEFYDGKS